MTITKCKKLAYKMNDQKNNSQYHREIDRIFHDTSVERLKNTYKIKKMKAQ